jgi:ribosomal protein S21
MATNIRVGVIDGGVEAALRRLKKLVGYTGLFKEMKRHQERTKPGEARRVKSLRARRRERKRLQKDEAAQAEREARREAMRGSVG